MAEKIKVKDREGKILEVYEKAYEVVYKNAGYQRVKTTTKKQAPKKNATDKK